MRARFVPLLALGVLLPGCDGGPPVPLASCPDTASSAVDRAWNAYRAQDYQSGERAAGEALDLCPDDIGANTVMGYSLLQQQQMDRARDRFDAVLEQDSMVLDAVIGRGLLAWREGDLAAAHRMFARAVIIQPENELALGYLNRIPPGFGSVRRPPLALPDTVVYPARARAGQFEVRTPNGWRTFYVNGVNLGAALPGRHAGEFPDSAAYAGWVADMAAMNVNAVRVYTIHPPYFYQVLRAHNRTHPDDPIRLIHGVWTELPPEHDFSDGEWRAELESEMRRVVDLVHGRADIPPRPGHASGHYTADVSGWTLAYILGREWEPFAVEEYNRLRADETTFAGTYFAVEEGTPTDVWMAGALEALVAYEMDTYRAQRPVAYTSWPTLDPLEHPTETSVEQEIAIREALGERIERRPKEYDNDLVALDATLIRSSDDFPAGTFAAFHAYPYYPDFMFREPAYARAESPWGPSSYFGYLRALRRHHGDMPVLIAEFGVPTSRGSAHMHPQGWHHGGLDETDMARIDARLAREIHAAGLAGGIVFAWIDEWFKQNWLVLDFELPGDRNRLWLNPLDPEQHYGMLAMEPEPRLPGPTLADRVDLWREAAPLLLAVGETRVRALVDEACLWLLVEGVETGSDDGVMVGFDVVDPEAGELRWPGGVGPEPALGLEFALVIEGDSARLLAHDAYAPWQIEEVGERLDGQPRPPPDIVDPMPGFFSGRLEQRRNRPYQPEAHDDGEYAPIRVVTNRRRFTRDSTELAAYGYDRGILLEGEPLTGDWSRLPEQGVVEVRIPWGLLNVTDPSQRRVLYEEKRFLRRLPEVAGTRTVPGIGVVAAIRQDGAWRALPVPGGTETSARFEWAPWDEPRWRARQRPVFDSLQAVFAELEGAGGSP